VLPKCGGQLYYAFLGVPCVNVIKLFFFVADGGTKEAKAKNNQLYYDRHMTIVMNDACNINVSALNIAINQYRKCDATIWSVT
jgi:hypothetical protein